MADDGSRLDPVTDAQLDALWDAVTAEQPQGVYSASTPPPGSSDEYGRKRRAPAMIGVKSGDGSFDVEELHKMNRETKYRRVLPEDGGWVDEDGPDPGNRFGPQWRGEEITRQKILERDPNYQFITLVAGAANATVEKLYDEDSVGQAMRRRIAERQAQLAGQEATVELDKLQASLEALQGQMAAAMRLQGEVAERQATGFLAQAKLHHAAVAEYVASVKARRESVDMTNLLEIAADPMQVYATHGEMALRVINAQFADDESGDTGVRPIDLSALIMWDDALGKKSPRTPELIREIDNNARKRAEGLGTRYVAGGDVRDLLRGLHGFGWPLTGDAGAKARGAPRALFFALRRLIVLKHTSIENRDAAVENFKLVRIPVTRNGLNLVLDDVITGDIVSDFRRRSWMPWVAEADALAKMLRTAVELLEETSPLMSPTMEMEPVLSVEERTEARGVAAEELWRRRQQEAEWKRQTAAARGRGRAKREDLPIGAPPQGVLGQETEEVTSRELRARILLAKKNRRILMIGDAELAEYRAGVDAIEAFVSAAKETSKVQNPQAGVILRAANAVGGSDLANDIAFRKSVVQGVAPSDPSDLAKWAEAMSWYEEIGGDLFLRLQAKFPVGAKARKEARGGTDVPQWQLSSGRAPPGYSVRMQLLWNRHTATFSSAAEKVEMSIQRARVAAVPSIPRRASLVTQEEMRRRFEEMQRRLANVDMPSFTLSERIVYQVLKGIAPEMVMVSPPTREEQLANDSLLVVAARLYEAELAVAAAKLRRDVEERDGQIRSMRDRVDKMYRGEAVVRTVPEVPYEHRRGWVEQPEHSGAVHLIPIVTQAIATAWNRLQRTAPNVAGAVDIEFAQHDPQMRPDFADLVSIEMAIIAQRFPKQYIQLGQRAHTMTDLASVIQRFRSNFDLSHVAGRPRAAQPRPIPGRGASLVASITPTGQRRGNMILF